MGLIDRLRALFSLGGTGTADDADAGAGEAAGEPAGARQCSICGTRVDADATECPLCRSADLVPVDGDGEGTGGTDDGGSDTRSPETTDEAADRLRELRDADDEDG